MAKLSDLVNVNINRDKIIIQGAEIPISFSMETMEFIGDGYDSDYAIFEAELNAMMHQEKVRLDRKSLKIMRTLIYGMVRSGGTECTPKELDNSIPLSQVVNVFEVCLDLFQRQNFDDKDLKK
mgnify:CR=1 FL=1